MKINAEENTSQLHDQMTELVPPNSEVIEFGCGKGDLLIKLSSKIKFGKGIDKSEKHIQAARRRKKTKHINNIEFVCYTLGKDFRESRGYDFSVASLFFHVINNESAVYLLKKLGAISHTQLICGFSKPASLTDKGLLWLDQRFTNHYKNLRKYQKMGYMEGILEKLNISNLVIYNTPIPFIKLYKINQT